MKDEKTTLYFGGREITEDTPPRDLIEALALTGQLGDDARREVAGHRAEAFRLRRELDELSKVTFKLTLEGFDRGRRAGRADGLLSYAIFGAATGFVISLILRYLMTGGGL
jgi:hypothetical protein